MLKISCVQGVKRNSPKIFQIVPCTNPTYPENFRKILPSVFCNVAGGCGCGCSTPLGVGVWGGGVVWGWGFSTPPTPAQFFLPTPAPFFPLFFGYSRPKSRFFLTPPPAHLTPAPAHFSSKDPLPQPPNPRPHQRSAMGVYREKRKWTRNIENELNIVASPLR